MSRMFAKVYADSDSDSDSGTGSDRGRGGSSRERGRVRGEEGEEKSEGKGQEEGISPQIKPPDSSPHVMKRARYQTSTASRLEAKDEKQEEKQEGDKVEEQEDDSDDDWRKCLINYDPSKAPTISLSKPVFVKKHPLPPKPVVYEDDTSDSDADADDDFVSRMSLRKKRKPNPRTKKSGSGKDVSVTDLISLKRVDFSPEALAALPLEELCNLTISVYLEEKALTKDIAYLKTQLRTLPLRYRPCPLAEVVDGDEEDSFFDKPNASDVSGKYDKLDVPNKSDAPPDKSDKHFATPATSNEGRRGALGISTRPAASDCVLHTSLQHVNPLAATPETVLDMASRQEGGEGVGEVELSSLQGAQSQLQQQIVPISSPHITTLHAPPPPAAAPLPSFDLFLPPTSKTFFKCDEIEANHRFVPPLRPPIPSPVADVPIVQKTCYKYVESIQDSTLSDDDGEGREDENDEVKENQSPDGFILPSTAASTVFGIDLCMLTIIKFLDFETRKRVAVVSSDCYSVCSHNISFAQENTGLFPEPKLASRSLYQENVLVDCNQRYIEDNAISAVVKVGQTTETIKFHQSVWDECSEEFQQEVLEKFPKLVTIQQKTRAESIPAFGVVPHKMLKGLRGDSSSGGLKKIVDMSAQIVVLDRKAKEMKQVGESCVCLLGKICIRQPIKRKTVTQCCFNKSVWESTFLSEADKVKYFFSTGLVTREAMQGRVLLAGIPAHCRCSSVNSAFKSNSATKPAKGTTLVSTIDKRGGISYQL